jgi:polyvinyl alcohol dehydrogenase (cytochrome)
VRYRFSLVCVPLLAILCALPGAELQKKDETSPKQAASVSTDPKDWSMYNYDVIGTRHNAGERALSKDNVARLEEKWRFPAAGSKEKVGVIHATPLVVNGHVYFGTATLAAFYKLGPDGKVKWVYRNPDHSKPAALIAQFLPAGVPASGFINTALVTSDTVYTGDAGGIIYALDRFTGKERWKINTRTAGPFPRHHSSNCIFSAPILAEDRIIVGGGGFEHAVGANPKHRCCTGRGFVVALEPRTGKVIWKYDVGPEPKKLDPPVKIKDSYGEHVFHYGPSTSSVWSTSSYDAASRTIYFGTDTHNAPRQPTKDDPRLYTKHSCAVIALDAATGKEKWVTQLNPDDVWNYALRAYDPKTGRYKDQSIGDTPKLYTIDVAGKQVKVVGVGCKNGGFYVLDAATGKLLRNTPVYTGPPSDHPSKLDPRTLALPGTIGGLQTGCATDGKAIYTNGIDQNQIGTSEDRQTTPHPPTGGRVVSISLDTRQENWRHERPRVKAVGGTKEKPAFTNVGDPVGSGIALANGIAYFTTTVSNKLVALDTASGKVLREIDLGPVWCGPSVSRGRVYVGSGNILFQPGNPQEAYYPKRFTGTLYSFGLPGEDEVSRMGEGNEPVPAAQPK